MTNGRQRLRSALPAKPIWSDDDGECAKID
jgi:hypothetical protein